MKVHPLRYERELRGWSQARVAQEVGVDPLTVSRWEHGISKPFPYYREQLCTLFGKNADELGLLPTKELESTAQCLSSLSSPSLISPETIKPISDPLMPIALGHAGSLVGREALLKHLKQCVCKEGSMAPVALYGLPGIGKTALVMALVADPEVQAYFRDGILWAGLGTNPNVFGLLSRWGTLLEIAPTMVDDANSLHSWGIALRTAMMKRRMLLVIDDAWSIEEALAFQVGGPHCVYVVTTRHPEVALAWPWGASVQVPELANPEGLRLLARFVPELVTQDPRTAVHLVQQVGGLPLALTLIGKFLSAQVYSGQPRRLQKALAQMHEAEQRLRLSVPTSIMERPPSLPREVSLSLSAVIAISDQHLSAQARGALRALSSFPAKPNSFSEEAALVVAEVGVEVLDELLDTGMLESHSPGRYMLHQILADYGRVHMEDTSAMQRLVDYYVRYLQAKQIEAATVEQEGPNIRRALQEALTRRQLDSLRILQVAVPSLPAASVQSSGYLAFLPHDLLSREERDPLGMAMTAVYQGTEAWQHGHYKQAETALSEALDIAQRLGGHASLISYCYGLLAMVARSRGNYQQAEQHLSECLQLALQIGLKEEISAVHAVGCLLAQEQGNYTQAEVLGLEATKIAHKSGDPLLIHVALSYLGLVQFERGDDEQAHNSYLEALEQAQATANLEGVTHVLAYLSQQAYAQGEYQQAEYYAQEGLALARQHEYPEDLGLLLLMLGLMALSKGEQQQAEDHLREGLELARQITNPLMTGKLLMGWGVLQRELGQLEAAMQMLCEALTVIPEEVRAVRANCQYELAQVAVARGDLREAQTLATCSLTTLETIGHRDATRVKDARKTWLQP